MEALKNEGGEWVTCIDILKDMGVQFFNSLYSSDGPKSHFIVSKAFLVLIENEIYMLGREVTVDEVKGAFLAISEWKDLS